MAKKKKWTKKRWCFVGGLSLFLLSQILVSFVPYKTVPDEVRPVYDFVLRYRNKVINRLKLPIDLYPSKAIVEAGGGDVKILFAPSANIEKELIQFIDSAQTSVDLCVFELELPGVINALIKAKERLVEVRIVIDEDYQGEPHLAKLHKADIPIKTDGRKAFMHNKFVIVDEIRTWTGSYNFTWTGTHRNDNNVVVIDSELLAENYTKEFNEMWNSSDGFFGTKGFGPASPASTPNTKISFSDFELENYFAPEDQVMEKILSEIDKSQYNIRIMAFSFTSIPLAEKLAQRMEDGVNVKVLFNARGADTEYSRMKWLKAKGAFTETSFNTRGVMHNKVIIIDRKTVITGSYNFSKNADTNNDENILIIRSPQIAAIYEEEFQRCLRGVKGY